MEIKHFYCRVGCLVSGKACGSILLNESGLTNALQEMPVHVTDILAGAPAPGAPLAAAASSGNVGVGGAQQ